MAGIKIKGGPESERLAYTPAEGELVYTTDEKKLYIGNGFDIGGTLCSGSGGGVVTEGLVTLFVDSDTNAENNRRYIFDSSVGPFSITLPLNPVGGDYLEIMDINMSNTFYTVSILRNTRSINGIVDDLLMDVKGGVLKLTYTTSPFGWYVDYNTITYTVATGPKGDTGPQGPQGLIGSAGAKGVKGDTGPAGMTGPQGTIGPAGPTGLKGDKGDTGAKGDVGPRGPTGLTGLTGPAGIKGDTGPAGYGMQGPQGPAGPSGTGPAGAKGDKGDTGLQGPAGSNGLTGPKGDTGNTGPAGSNGTQGIQGEVGPQGPAGPDNITATTATTLSGLLKGDGATVSAATAGTDYQAPLASGTNIKTINNESILGSGNITVEGGTGGGTEIPSSDIPPDTPVDGDLWIDTAAIQQSGGTVLKGGISGTLISEQVLTADSSVVNFTGLNSLVDGDYTLECAVEHFVGTVGDGYLLINGDNTPANYDGGTLQFFGTSIAGFNTNNIIPSVIRPESGKTSVSTTQITVLNGKVWIRCLSFNESSTYPNQVDNWIGSIYYPGAPVTAITSLSIYTGVANSIKVGSKFRLYGSNVATKLIDYSPQDFTGLTSDRLLKAGEVAYIDFPSTTSVPLHIAIENNAQYEVSINADSGRDNLSTDKIMLLPNNSSATLYTLGNYYHGVDAIERLYGSDTGFVISTYNLNSAKLDIQVGAVGSMRILSSATASMGGQHMRYETSVPVTPASGMTSLGTITFTYNHIGRIVIRRII